MNKQKLVKGYIKTTAEEGVILEQFIAVRENGDKLISHFQPRCNEFNKSGLWADYVGDIGADFEFCGNYPDTRA